jgi:hypothetical protein
MITHWALAIAASRLRVLEWVMNGRQAKPEGAQSLVRYTLNSRRALLHGRQLALFISTSRAAESVRP